GDQFSTFKITQPGSYYLTGNITGEADKHGIQIAVSNVTIDLNGFSMIGVDDSRSGIASNNRSGISVRNGTVYAWDGWGIDLGACNDGTLEGVVAYGNAGGGARVGAHYAVTRCTFSSNQQYGLSAGSSCTISGC